MKSAKKNNDLSCVPNGIVKEEPCVDPCKMTAGEKGATAGNNSESTERSDANNCTRESNTGSANNPEDTSTRKNKNTVTNNQKLSNPVKLENNSPYSTCNVSNDCAGTKPETNLPGKCGRNGASGGESQFMQQQSHIFVFSTMLANKGAEAVLRGQFPSIVAYHCAQPGTKKFLEKHPNKGNKFGQPPEWLNNFSVPTTQKNQQPCSNNFIRQTPELPVLDPDPPTFWNEQPNVNRNTNNEKPVTNAESSVDDTIDKVVNSQPSPDSHEDTARLVPGSLQPSLQGVKVPDENLTPQQRQHREEQLATIRKMQILLFSNRKEEPENSLTTAQSTQAQTFVSDGGNSPLDTSLDNFSSGVDWDNLQDQLFDPKNKVMEDNSSTIPSSGVNVAVNSRSQGPPPPYHQSSRPASVPAALQNSNPSSPNNPTSTLSLPSPRASSALNSPADCGRHFHQSGQKAGYLPTGSPIIQDSLTSGVGTASAGMENPPNQSNPGTPVSHSHLVAFSPSTTTTQKDSIDFAAAQSPNVDDIFCQTLQSVNQDQRERIGSVIGSKEANLMPVPSPQQIQYLNTFEGQELTIQKQQNTSLKDTTSPSNTGSITTSAMRLLPETSNNQCSTIGLGGTSPMTDSSDRGFTGSLHSPRTPRTPTSNTPHTPFDSSTSVTGNKMSSGQNSPASYGQNLTDNTGRQRTVAESPKPKDSSPSSNKNQHQLSTGNSNDSKNSLQTIAPDFSCGRTPVSIRGQHENVPLNPNNINNCRNIQGSVNTSHFDPITSLAQMSQQLANITPSNTLGDVPIMHSGNPGMSMNPPNMHSMQEMNGLGGGEYGEVGLPSGMGSCVPTGYNPAPRMGNMGIPNRVPGQPSFGYGAMHPAAYHGEPRGPPRPMEHNLTRANVQVKPGAPNTIQYLPAAKPNPCQGGPRPPPSLDFLQNFTNPSNQRFFPNNTGPMHNMQTGYGGVSRPQRPNGFQMRSLPTNVHPGPNPMRMQHMVGGGMFPGNRMNLDKPFGGEIVPQMPNQPNPRMYAPGNQGNIMGLRPRAPSQPIHPNMDAANNFKNRPFLGNAGPPTSDPNYAQQYHNFQQQLYATGTRPHNPHLGTSSPSFLPER